MRNVWVAFQVFEKRKGHHAWHGSDPMRGEDPEGINATLFREGFLKYEVGLKTVEFNSGTAELNSRLDINALVNTSPNWWRNIEHFISEVLACGENNNAALLICQFCRKLKQASQNGDDLTAAETSLIEELVIKRDVEAIHHTLANTTGRPIIWGIRICDVPLGKIKFGGTRQ